MGGAAALLDTVGRQVLIAGRDIRKDTGSVVDHAENLVVDMIDMSRRDTKLETPETRTWNSYITRARFFCSNGKHFAFSLWTCHHRWSYIMLCQPPQNRFDQTERKHDTVKGHKCSINNTVTGAFTIAYGRFECARGRQDSLNTLVIYTLAHVRMLIPVSVLAKPYAVTFLKSLNMYLRSEICSP
jgi:hypothetical protein